MPAKKTATKKATKKKVAKKKLTKFEQTQIDHAKTMKERDDAYEKRAKELSKKK